MEAVLMIAVLCALAADVAYTAHVKRELSARLDQQKKQAEEESDNRKTAFRVLKTSISALRKDLFPRMKEAENAISVFGWKVNDIGRTIDVLTKETKELNEDMDEAEKAVAALDDQMEQVQQTLEGMEDQAKEAAQEQARWFEGANNIMNYGMEDARKAAGSYAEE